jgi:excisionase family DNA binding protein
VNSDIGLATSESRLLTLAELAERENLNEKYLKLLVRGGLIPAMKFGRDLRFNGDAVRAALRKVASECYTSKEPDLATAASSEC